MDVRVGVEGSERGRKKRKKGRRGGRCVFWLRPNCVSQLYRHIQIK